MNVGVAVCSSAEFVTVMLFPALYARKTYERDVSGSADYSLTLEGGTHAYSQPNIMFRARLTDRTSRQTGSRRTDVGFQDAGVVAFGCPADSGA
jgi:hypothetical protein